MTDVAILIQIVVQVGFPVALAWWLSRRYAGDKVDTLRIFLGGMLGYAVSQAALLALSQLLSLVDLSGVPEQQRAIGSVLGFGIGVGVIEELARYGILRLWLKDVRSWGHGLLFGAGHGGSESLFTGLVGAIWFMTMRSLRSAPPPGEELSEADQAGLDQVLAAYWNTPWQTPLLSAVQQVFMVVLSLALATLVMRVFLTGRFTYLAAAVGLHVLAATSLVGLGQISMPLSVAVSGALAVLGIVIIVRYAEAPAAEPEAAPPPPAADSAGGKPATHTRRKRTRKS